MEDTLKQQEVSDEHLLDFELVLCLESGLTLNVDILTLNFNNFLFPSETEENVILFVQLEEIA